MAEEIEIKAPILQFVIGNGGGIAEWLCTSLNQCSYSMPDPVSTVS